MFAPFAQGFPPLPDGNSVDLGRLLMNMGLAVVWTLVASISFAVAISIGLRLFDALIPGLDEIGELKKGNMAVALVFATFIISLTAIVVAILLK